MNEKGIKLQLYKYCPRIGLLKKPVFKTEMVEKSIITHQTNQQISTLDVSINKAFKGGMSETNKCLLQFLKWEYNRRDLQYY